MSNSLIIEFNLSDHTSKKLTLDELNSIDLSTTQKVYWIHCNLNQSQYIKPLTQKLTLPNELIQLCNKKDMMPQVIDTEESLTIQIQCLLTTEINEYSEVNLSNFIIYLTKNFCFTASFEPIPVLTEFVENYQKSIRYAQTSSFILFLLLDSIINDYAKILFSFELISENLDSEVRSSKENLYFKVANIKHQLMKTKKYIISIREILSRISSRKISALSNECRISLSELAGHCDFVNHEADSVRDFLNSLLGQIDNRLMQTMNETMRVLTAFATIFLPLTLITGIYGMNFAWMPELTWKYGYFFALALIAICGGLILFLFKKMKWF